MYYCIITGCTNVVTRYRCKEHENTCSVDGCTRYAERPSCDYHRQKAFKAGQSLARTRIEYNITIIPKKLFQPIRHYEDYTVDPNGVGTTKEENL